MNTEKEISKETSKKYKTYIRGDIEDAWTLSYEEYKKKTLEKWRSDGKGVVYIEE